MRHGLRRSKEIPSRPVASFRSTYGIRQSFPWGKVPSRARRMRGGMHGILHNVRRIGAGFPSSVTTLRWRQLPPGEALCAVSASETNSNLTEDDNIAKRRTNYGWYSIKMPQMWKNKGMERRSKYLQVWYFRGCARKNSSFYAERTACTTDHESGRLL